MMRKLGKTIAGVIASILACASVVAEEAANVASGTEVDRLRALNVELAGRLREKELEIQGFKNAAERLSGQLERMQRDLEAARQRGQKLADQLAANVVARIHEILPAGKRSCENIEVTVDADGSIHVSGRLINVDQVKRQLADLARPEGIAFKTTELEGLIVCGQPIGDGWIVETAESGWRLAALRELRPDTATRLPQGTDGNCQAIGAKLDALDRPDLVVRRAFWALRPGSTSAPRFGYCEPSPAGAEWRYSEVDVPHLRGLVVQRSP
jgi:hypothetical protein